MFEIDKRKFGAFIVQLRKEKGLTQKDVAKRLFISDKAVSKWERGLSLPDITLLVPLAAVLDVTVAELLEGQRISQEHAMPKQQVETLVKRAIHFSDEQQEHSTLYRKRLPVLVASILVALLEVVLLRHFAQITSSILQLELLWIAFSLYFCLFVPERLLFIMMKTELAPIPMVRFVSIYQAFLLTIVIGPILPASVVFGVWRRWCCIRCLQWRIAGF